MDDTICADQSFIIAIRVNYALPAETLAQTGFSMPD
jgi:hypothetical protein